MAELTQKEIYEGIERRAEEEHPQLCANLNSRVHNLERQIVAMVEAGQGIEVLPVRVAESVDRCWADDLADEAGKFKMPLSPSEERARKLEAQISEYQTETAKLREEALYYATCRSEAQRETDEVKEQLERQDRLLERRALEIESLTREDPNTDICSVHWPHCPGGCIEKRFTLYEAAEFLRVKMVNCRKLDRQARLLEVKDAKIKALIVAGSEKFTPREWREALRMPSSLEEDS